MFLLQKYSYVNEILENIFSQSSRSKAMLNDTLIVKVGTITIVVNLLNL